MKFGDSLNETDSRNKSVVFSTNKFSFNIYASSTLAKCGKIIIDSETRDELNNDEILNKDNLNLIPDVLHIEETASTSFPDDCK